MNVLIYRTARTPSCVPARTPARAPARAALVALVALLVGAAPAQAATPLPPVHHSGDVQYLSGGIGTDEALAVEHAGRHWPLTLEFAVKNKQRADFVADVDVVVRDAQGHIALQATAGGPFLLAKLAPGHYAVDVTFAGQTLHEKVDVKQGHAAKALFIWPPGTGGNHS